MSSQGCLLERCGICLGVCLPDPEADTPRLRSRHPLTQRQTPPHPEADTHSPPPDPGADIPLDSEAETPQTQRQTQPLPWTEGMIPKCENITFRQLLLWVVIRNLITIHNSSCEKVNVIPSVHGPLPHFLWLRWKKLEGREPKNLVGEVAKKIMGLGGTTFWDGVAKKNFGAGW